MNDYIDFNVLLSKIAIGVLLGMALIGAVRLIDGNNHRLGQIKLPARISQALDDAGVV